MTHEVQAPKIKVSKISRNNDSLVVQGTLYGKKCDITVGTGATRSVVRRDMVPRTSINEYNCRPIQENAKGNEIMVYGNATINVGLRNTVLPMEVIVADIVDEFILGLDIMKQFNFISVDFEKRLLNVGNEEILFSTSTEKNNRIRLIKDEDEPIRHQQMFLQVFKTTWDHLSEEERKKPIKFVKEEADIFAGAEITGRTSLVKDQIDTGYAKPIRQPPRRLTFAKQHEVVPMNNEMLKDGVIDESSSPWSLPVALVTKKDGSTKFLYILRFSSCQ
ncbi:hypothetical protein NQ315_014640 [Exocentrus adspersus]|uniref:Uncharacterized protein n=1 Tax=Exocentrus adspersus TaxID=1586481 RepID=A0AAV8VPQ9_9CUCU|nr:hypothetical protein NQ315_014640 [Exocentrus adspersus]